MVSNQNSIRSGIFFAYIPHFFLLNSVKKILETTSSNTSSPIDDSHDVSFYDDDPALPVYHWGLTKGMATDDIATVLIQEKIDQSKIAQKVPTNISKNTVFILDTTKLLHGEDMRCDDMGAWLCTGSRRFDYSVDDEGKINRETELDNQSQEKPYQLNRQFFKNKSAPSVRKAIRKWQRICLLSNIFLRKGKKK